VIYLRNLYLIFRERQAQARAAHAQGA
jgi:hypothetical protein